MIRVHVAPRKNLRSVVVSKKQPPSPALLPLKDQVVEWVHSLQLEIIRALEAYEPEIRFGDTNWERPGGGGGKTRILSRGEIFEKAGVNTSVVFGELSPLMSEKLQVKSKDFFATGISLVIHPRSPKIPSVHANFRYFEQPDRAWFGGGTDLTPYCISEEDFVHFHQVLKEACDTYAADSYEKFKKRCDEYFYLPHREETRGVGGIFFDYQTGDLQRFFEFVKRCGGDFVKAYLPIVDRNHDKPFSDREKKFQLLRRGRYVEFNLLYDRGTLFGLQTKGNTESILMSLPPEVHFDYTPDLVSNNEERQLLEWLKHPRSWT